MVWHRAICVVIAEFLFLLRPEGEYERDGLVRPSRLTQYPLMSYSSELFTRRVLKVWIAGWLEK